MPRIYFCRLDCLKGKLVLSTTSNKRLIGFAKWFSLLFEYHQTGEQPDPPQVRAAKTWIQRNTIDSQYEECILSVLSKISPTPNATLKKIRAGIEECNNAIVAKKETFFPLTLWIQAKVEKKNFYSLFLKSYSDSL